MYTEYASKVSHEIERTLKQIEAEQVETMIDLILDARRIFVAGAGRTGLMARGFAMRLMHMGLAVHVVGDVTTPGIGEGDMLLVGSGSGETGGLVLMAEKAAAYGARVGLVTIFPASSIGKRATCVVRIPAPTPKSREDGGATSIQPMGSLFEQCLLIVLDIIILLLMERKQDRAERMFDRHANLE